MDGSTLYCNTEGNEFQRQLTSAIVPPIVWTLTTNTEPREVRVELLNQTRTSGMGRPTPVNPPNYLSRFGEDSELSDATLNLISENGSSSQCALGMMRADDIPALGVSPLGQRRLLETAVISLKGDSGNAVQQSSQWTLQLSEAMDLNHRLHWLFQGGTDS